MRLKQQKKKLKNKINNKKIIKENGPPETTVPQATCIGGKRLAVLQGSIYVYVGSELDFIFYFLVVRFLLFKC
jgi:hypothetical protein